MTMGNGRPPGGMEGLGGQMQKNGRMASSEGALEYVLRVLRRRWLIFVIALVAVPLVALGVSASKEKLYTANATLLFETEADNFDPARETATNEALATLPVVAQRAAEEMGEGTTASEVLGAVSAEPGEGMANVASISATTPEPERSAEIANGYSKAYIAFRKETDQSQVQQAIDLVESSLEDLTPEERAGPQGEKLAERLNDLKVQQALQTGRTVLVQPASVPDSPSSPKTKRNVVIGLILGLALGFALAAMMERIDRRIRSTEELETMFGAPIIARISRSKDLRRLPPGDILLSHDAEDFRTLRTNLRYFNVDRELTSVLFASAEPGDGKSTVARGLAAAMAEVGEDVLLMECDMRKESDFRPPHGNSGGLSGVLTGLPLSEAIIDLPLSVPTSGQPRSLAVLPSGPVPPNPSELLESERMQELMREVHERYKIVIIDSPALTVVSDALALAPYASEVLAVGGVRHTTQDGISTFLKQLGLLGKRPVGVIATFTDPNRKRYAYYQRSGMAARR